MDFQLKVVNAHLNLSFSYTSDVVQCSSILNAGFDVRIRAFWCIFTFTNESGVIYRRHFEYLWVNYDGLS